MSFILDALKKSESDRQRQSGPALYEVKVVPPRSRFPLWAVALSLLLGVNLVIAGWLLLRHPSASTTTADASAPSTMSSGTPAPSMMSGVVSPRVAESNATPGSATVGATAPNNTTAPGSGTAPSGGTAPSSGTPPSGAPSVPVAQQGAPESPPTRLAGQGAAAAPVGSTASAAENPTGAGGPNPDDYAPAAEPGPSTGLTSHVKRATASGYVLYQDAELIPGANLPQLRLDLHVYAMKPQDRFCLINMR